MDTVTVDSDTSASDDFGRLYMCLGLVVRERRRELKLSQQRLAELADVDRAFLCNVELGKRKPSFGVVARLAPALKLKYSALVARCEAKAK